jgi:hypothetical protein
LIFIIKGLEEGASELTDLVELRVDVAQERVSLKERRSNQVCERAAVIELRDSKVVLIWLSSLPD